MFTPKRIINRSKEAEKLGLFFYDAQVTLKKWDKNKGFYGKSYTSQPYITNHGIVAFRDGICLQNSLEIKSMRCKTKASKNKIIYRPINKKNMLDLCYSLAGHITKIDNLDIKSFVNGRTIYNKAPKLMYRQMINITNELEILILKDLEKDDITF